MKNKIVLGLALAATSSMALSNDFDRTGAFTTFGLGLNVGAKFGIKTDDGSISADAIGIMSTQAKLGYGIDNTKLISLDYDVGLITDEDLISLFTTSSFSVAGTYFFKETAAAPYVLAGLGYTSAKVTDVETSIVSEPVGGLSYKFGGGYQFAKHFQVEASFMNNSLKENSDDELSMSLSSLQIKLQYVNYSY